MAKIVGIHTSGELIGSVKIWTLSAVPENYLLCDGSAISRTTYADLFDKIGTIYGAGDGSTTFCLPDYRGIHLRGLINIPAVTGTGTAASSNATFTNHGLRTGMRVRMTSGTLSPLATATNYYAIVIDANTLAFANSQALATAASPTKIAISGANSAVIQQWMDPDATNRVAPQTGANSGANVGSFQEDQIISHSHSYRNNENNGASNSGTSADPASKNFYDRATGSVGGNQTNPANAYVNYIIVYR